MMDYSIRLIAEFMGYKIDPSGWIILNAHDQCLPSVMKYDTSWDALMPVIIAIEEIEEPHPSLDPRKGTVWPYQVDLLSRNKVEIYDHINDNSISLVDQDGLTKIEAAYKAVVGFIEWYNTFRK